MLPLGTVSFQTIQLTSQIRDLQLVVFLRLQTTFAVDRRLDEVGRHRARHGVEHEGRQDRAKSSTNNHAPTMRHRG